MISTIVNASLETSSDVSKCLKELNTALLVSVIRYLKCNRVCTVTKPHRIRTRIKVRGRDG